MVQPDLFLSYASADLAAAESLKRWLEAAPRQRSIWRDREGILPGAPDYSPSDPRGHFRQCRVCRAPQPTLAALQCGPA